MMKKKTFYDNANIAGNGQRGPVLRRVREGAWPQQAHETTGRWSVFCKILIDLTQCLSENSLKISEKINFLILFNNFYYFLKFFNYLKNNF
jgi:hypothetical protein